MKSCTCSKSTKKRRLIHLTISFLESKTFNFFLANLSTILFFSFAIYPKLLDLSSIYKFTFDKKKSIYKFTIFHPVQDRVFEKEPETG